jgi:DNA-binding response OmpR family regulator
VARTITSARPFDNDELLARIEALLRRAQISHDGTSAKQMRFGRFVIDSGSVQAIAGDRQVQLTADRVQAPAHARR